MLEIDDKIKVMQFFIEAFELKSDYKYERSSKVLLFH